MDRFGQLHLHSRATQLVDAGTARVELRFLLAPEPEGQPGTEAREATWGWA